MILFDQRGAGQSLPSGELRENTSQDLVSDFEVLRKHFGVHRWHVFGGSWGAVLSLLYAQTHPEAVVSLTLRGISFRGSCFETQAERGFDDVFQCTRRTHPEIFEELIGYLTMEERKDLTGSYSRRISSGDRTEELAAAKMYDKWAGVMSRLVPQEDNTDATITEAEEDHLIASSRIDCHYHAHSCWLREMHFLEPEKLEEIKHIPCGIVNGRYDQLCPPIMAWRLHKALPKSKLFIILDAGHSAAVRFRSSLYQLSHTKCRHRSRVHGTSLSRFAMSLQHFPYDRRDP